MKTIQNTSADFNRWQSGIMARLCTAIPVICLFMIFTIFVGEKSYGQGIGISETSIIPDASAILELRYSSGDRKGFLPPRMTTADRNSIVSPAEGLIIFNTETNKLCIFDGTLWVNLFSGSSGVNSITGTANRISISGTEDVSVDIAGTYAGQTSINTLGTIGTGTWNGGIIAGQYGGTGVANTGWTITLGGNINTSESLSTVGNDAITLNTSAATNITLPTTGTLATQAGNEALTNKTINGNIITAGTGTLTIAAGRTLTVSDNATVSGTNTGDNAINSLYSGLVSNATHTGDATGATTLTVVGINGTSLAGLATGILKNTTGTGVPSIAVASDFPILNQSTTGNAATVTTNANLTGPITSVGNATSVASQTGTGSTFVMNTSPTLVTPNLGTPTALVGTNITGTAAGLTAGNVTTNANLTGEVTSVGNATTVTNAAVIGKVLTGYVSGAGTVAATDNILQAIQKLNGNAATNANLTGPITSVGNATSVASQTGTGSTFVMNTSPTLVTPNLGTPTALVGTNITGTAAGLTAGNVTTNANLTGPITSVGNATSVASQTGTGSTFVMNTSPTLVTPNLGTPTALVGTNITGTAAGLTAGNVTTNANLTGEVTSVGNATTVTNAAVIGKVLTGYVSGAGTVAATDNILQAIQKLNGNAATNANLTGPITSVGNATSVASQTGTGSTFVMNTSPTLVTPIIGDATGTSLTLTGNVSGAQLTSTIATGTAPLVVTSTTPVANLSIGGNAATATRSTNISGGLIGQIPYQSAVNTTLLLAAGTAGQVLTSGGAGAPSWTTPTTGTVTSVSGTAPVVSSGGNTPAISMAAATSLVPGYLTPADWNTFNGKQSVLTNSAGLAGALSDETGTGLSVFATSPALTTPNIGAATGTSLTLTGNVSGAQLTSTIATGTAPLVVTSTTPVANLNIGGNAATATRSTNISGGLIGQIPYQSAVNTTLLLAAGTAGQVLTSGGAGAPSWTTPTTGTVTNVSGTAPVVSSGGNTPAISMAAATSLVDGYLTSANWNTFNGKQNVLTNSAGLAGALSDETGTGLSVFATSPALTTPNIGAATGTSLTLTGNVSGAQLTSTIATGTAPLVVTSTTPVANLSIGGNAATATRSTNISGGLIGQIPYQSAVNTTLLLAAGTAGQVLTSGGAGAPSWTTPTTGTVTSVSGTAPVVSSGGNTPAISMAAATSLVPGYLTPADWNTFNGKQSVLTNSAGLAGALSDETGTGLSVFATSPILTTPTINGSISGTTIIPVANGGTGSSTQNFVDLSTIQTVGGAKTFTAGLSALSGTVNINVSSDNPTNINTGNSNGTVTVGASSVAQTVNIGTGTAVATVNIATGNVAGDINIGDNTGTTASSVIIGGSTTINGSFNFGGTSGGAANAQTITISPAPTALTPGLVVVFIAGFSSTFNPTLNVNGLGAIPLYRSDTGVQLTTQIVSGSLYMAIYSGTRFYIIR